MAKIAASLKAQGRRKAGSTTAPLEGRALEQGDSLESVHQHEDRLQRLKPDRNQSLCSIAEVVPSGCHAKLSLYRGR